MPLATNRESAQGFQDETSRLIM